MCKALKISLGTYVAVNVLLSAALAMHIQILDQAKRDINPFPDPTGIDAFRIAGGTLVSVIVVFVTMILFIRWTYLSNKNARALGATNMKFSPEGSVGWYFVPIAALWKPLEALKETFQASNPNHQGPWYQAPAPKVLPFWWGLWLISSLIGRIAYHHWSKADSAIPDAVMSWWRLACHVLRIPLGIVVLGLVTTLQRWQARKHAALLTSVATVVTGA